MPRTAKLFHNGRSQAVGSRRSIDSRARKYSSAATRSRAMLFCRRRPESWQDFFELADRIKVPEDFMADRDDRPPQKRKLF